MSKKITKRLLRVCLDYDDVLAECNGFAIDMINKSRKKKDRFDVNNIKSFYEDDGSLQQRLKLYKDPNFVMMQPLYPGAKEFIHELSKKAEIFITSAVEPQCMSARATRILQDFPEIKPENIILGASKKLYDADIMLDDGSHNILSSGATYPVLMRRPWNENLSGTLAVNNYDDFLHLIELIYSNDGEIDLSNGGVVCLVGPSGSGKTTIVNELLKENKFVKPITTTTRTKRDDEPNDAYYFVDEETFLTDLNAGKFLESTVYSGNHYGTSADELNAIIDNKKIAIFPIDICGGITIKNVYREKAVLVFIDRARQDIILEILARNCSNEQKMRRIISLDMEDKNESFCDYSVRNDGTIEDVAEQIKGIVRDLS